MTETISAERLAELQVLAIAAADARYRAVHVPTEESVRIAYQWDAADREEELHEELEASELVALLAELANYRERESASTVQYALKWSNGELNPLGLDSGTTLGGIRHRARQEQSFDPDNERPAVLRRSVTFGPWVEVTDDEA